MAELIHYARILCSDDSGVSVQMLEIVEEKFISCQEDREAENSRGYETVSPLSAPCLIS